MAQSPFYEEAHEAFSSDDLAATQLLLDKHFPAAVVEDVVGFIGVVWETCGQDFARAALTLDAAVIVLAKMREHMAQRDRAAGRKPQ